MDPAANHPRRPELAGSFLRLALVLALAGAVTIAGCGGSPHRSSAGRVTSSSEPARSCTRTFDPGDIGSDPYPGANVNGALLRAATGSRFCFAAGSYGEIDLYDAHPPGPVAFTPAPGAAVAMGHIVANGISDVTVTGFSNASSIDGLSLIVAGHGPNSNIAFTDNAMSTTGVSVTDNPIANANISISHNSFVGFTTSGEQARLNIARDTGCPDGITVSYNVMSGGDSDGIDVGGGDCQTQIIHNVVQGVGPGSCNGIHCDGFQDNGGSNHDVVAYNYFRDGDCFLMDDGSINLTIHDNVCVGTGSYMVQYGGAINLTIDHNTFASTSGSSMGTWGRDHSIEHCVPSANVTLIDNVLGGGLPTLNATDECGQGPPEGTYAREDYNLIQGGGGTGAHDLTGSATFTGGPSPASWAGFKLAPDSLGRANASDGLDRGVPDFSPAPGP